MRHQVYYLKIHYQIFKNIIIQNLDCTIICQKIRMESIEKNKK